MGPTAAEAERTGLSAVVGSVLPATGGGEGEGGVVEPAAHDQREPDAAVRLFPMSRRHAPPDILDALSRGYSAGALFAIAGIVLASALIRADESQPEDA